MAASLPQTRRMPSTEFTPAKWIAAILALALSPALAFLYLQERSCARRYLLLNLLVFSLGGLFAFLGYEQFTLSVVLFCNFALVSVPGAAHINAYSLEDRHYERRPLCSRLPFLLSLPILFALAVYALDSLLSVKHMENTAMAPTLPQGVPYVLDKVSFQWREPRRGDIVAFTSRSPLGDVTRISRIIGLPGDSIAVEAGRPVLNDVPLPRVQEGEYVPTIDASTAMAASYVEKLPEGVVFAVRKSVSAGSAPFDHRPEITVAPDSFYVLGDNRDVARDSRDQLQVGLVKRSDIVGHVFPLLLTEHQETSFMRGLAWLKGLFVFSDPKADPV